MPQLPSGRHVGIGPAPFGKLMDDANHFGNIHKIMAIDCIQTLHDWFEVLYFIAPEEGIETQSEWTIADPTVMPPKELATFNTGVRLSKWTELASDWSKEDRDAMRDFLSSSRFTQYLERELSVAQNQQARYFSEGSMTTQILAAWCVAGIHPSQEENWDESDSVVWDCYDMFAALSYVTGKIATEPALYNSKTDVFDRLAGVWAMLLENYAFLRTHANTSSEVRANAKIWRLAKHLENLPDEKQAWLFKQMIIECINLWNHADEIVKNACPEAWDIIVLVTLSPIAIELGIFNNLNQAKSLS